MNFRTCVEKEPEKVDQETKLVGKIFDGMCVTVNFPTKEDGTLSSTLELQRTEHTRHC